MKLKINQKHLRRFRMRALKRAPQEYIEALYGSVWRPGSYEIVNVRAFRVVEQVAGPAHIAYVLADEPSIFNGWKLVGTIHSHPYDSNQTHEPDCAPSETDWANVQKEHSVVGICVVEPPGTKPRTRVKFFSAKAWVQVVT